MFKKILIVIIVEIAILVRPFDMIKIAPNFFLVTKDEASKHNPWIRTTRSFGKYVTAAKKWQDTGGAFEDSQLRPWETISTTISLVTRTGNKRVFQADQISEIVNTIGDNTLRAPPSTASGPSTQSEDEFFLYIETLLDLPEPLAVSTKEKDDLFRQIAKDIKSSDLNPTTPEEIPEALFEQHLPEPAHVKVQARVLIQNARKGGQTGSRCSSSSTRLLKSLNLRPSTTLHQGQRLQACLSQNSTFSRKSSATLSGSTRTKSVTRCQLIWRYCFTGSKTSRCILTSKHKPRTSH